MRKRDERSEVSLHVIAGTYVVLLGMNATSTARGGLLGFAIHRTDHTENEQYWLKGFKTFRETEPSPCPGTLYSTREHPIQSFLWGDYTAKADHDYTYKIVPIYGKPKNLVEGEPVAVRISTESEDSGTHAVFFNRGVSASQAYARKFRNKKPEDVPNRKAFKWLSRGLEEAILKFIGQADGPEYSLRAAVYEFNYEPVLQAFKKAADSGADVKIVYDARKEQPQQSSDRAIEQVGIRHLMKRRATHSSYISHNKFIVLLKNDRPVQVWTGSTNFTTGGIFGQSNVGHLVRDEAVAEKYYEYWLQLKEDPENRELRKWVAVATPDPAGAPAPSSMTPLFSPRSSLEVLKWYASRMDAAEGSVNLTAAFGVNPLLAEVLSKNKDYLRYLLLERRGQNYDVYARDPDVRVSIGSKLDDDYLFRWTKERLTGFNKHVNYVHTKFMLIDPLSQNPTVISGSANFSDNSTTKNDENMLVIQDDTRVADIYLGEFARLFNHFYFRYIANLLRTDEASPDRSHAFLKPDDSWTEKYYQPGSIKEKQRLLFA